MFPLVFLVVVVRVTCWDYRENGMDWSSLGLCGTSVDLGEQSPIDLRGGEETTPIEAERNLFTAYPLVGTPLKLYNNGQSIALTVPETYKAGFGFGFLESDLLVETAEIFRFWQMSFHSPSEHMLNGKRAALELQMVHQRVTGPDELAVVSVLFEEGSERNVFLDVIMKQSESLPTEVGDEQIINTDWQTRNIDFASLLRGAGFYRYVGSMTVPPCEGGVTYIVRQKTLAASLAQLKIFADTLKGNYRKLQGYNTASRNVTSLNSHDVIDGVQGLAEIIHATQAEPECPTRAELEAQRETETFTPADSELINHAKKIFQTALMNQRAECFAVATTGQEKTAARLRLNRATSGDDFNTLRAEVAASIKQADEQVSKCKGAERGIDAATKLMCYALRGQFEAGDNSTANATRATANATCRTWHYPSEVHLPRGMGASPFNANVAQSSARVTVHSQFAERIAPNLHQPDAVDVALPQLVSCAADAATTDPIEVVLELPITIDYQNATAVGVFERDLAEAISNSTGVPLEAVEVPQVRRGGLRLGSHQPVLLSHHRLARVGGSSGAFLKVGGV